MDRSRLCERVLRYPRATGYGWVFHIPMQVGEEPIQEIVNSMGLLMIKEWIVNTIKMLLDNPSPLVVKFTIVDSKVTTCEVLVFDTSATGSPRSWSAHVSYRWLCALKSQARTIDRFTRPQRKRKRSSPPLLQSPQSEGVYAYPTTCFASHTAGISHQLPYWCAAAYFMKSETAQVIGKGSWCDEMIQWGPRFDQYLIALIGYTGACIPWWQVMSTWTTLPYSICWCYAHGMLSPIGVDMATTVSASPLSVMRAVISSVPRALAVIADGISDDSDSENDGSESEAENGNIGTSRMGHAPTSNQEENDDDLGETDIEIDELFAGSFTDDDAIGGDVDELISEPAAAAADDDNNIINNTNTTPSNPTPCLTPPPTLTPPPNYDKDLARKMVMMVRFNDYSSDEDEDDKEEMRRAMYGSGVRLPDPDNISEESDMISDGEREEELEREQELKHELERGLGAVPIPPPPAPPLSPTQQDRVATPPPPQPAPRQRLPPPRLPPPPPPPPPSAAASASPSPSPVSEFMRRPHAGQCVWTDGLPWLAGREVVGGGGGAGARASSSSSSGSGNSKSRWMSKFRKPPTPAPDGMLDRAATD